MILEFLQIFILESVNLYKSNSRVHLTFMIMGYILQMKGLMSLIKKPCFK